MSLADRLQHLASWWDDVLERRAEFTADGARNFARDLHEAATEAAELERTSAPATIRRDLDRIDCALLTITAPNVIMFPRRHS